MDTLSHLFVDELSGDAVIVSPGRAHRPQDLKKTRDRFSPAGLASQTVLKTYGRGAFRLTAIENAYPVFRAGTPLDGRQEVLVEGSTRRPFTGFSAKDIQAVLEALQDRARAFRADPRLKCMVVFKNAGPAAGATQPHPHSQLYGLPFVPGRLKEISKRRVELVKKHKTSAHALLLDEATRERIIYQDKNVVAFTDPASRFAYGVRILPRRNFDNITQASKQELTSFAKAIHALLPLMRKHAWSFNFFFHDVFADAHECFEIRFTPRVNVWAGFEFETGIIINPVAAEEAAEAYRNA